MHRYAEEYRNARLRMQALAEDLADADAGRIVGACPEWRVHDLFSHVAGVASDLSAGIRPTGDLQQWVDGHVDDRRQRGFGEIVAEWSASGPAYEAFLDAAAKPSWSLTYDTIVHEHDLRAALGRPGERDTEGVRFGVELGMKLVRFDLANNDLPAFRLVLDSGEEMIAGEGQPQLTLEASAFEALRLLGSRRTMDELRSAAFTGDLDRYLPGLAHMPLPAVALGE
jgi:uncharacterized protein (TIGR03083 family)